MTGGDLGRVRPDVYQKMRFFSKDWFIALLNGERKLWEAYWVLGICIFIPAIFFELLSNTSLFSPAFTSVLIILLAILILLVQVVWAVAVWKCAPNVDMKIFYCLARIIVVVSILRSIAEIIS